MFKFLIPLLIMVLLLGDALALAPTYNKKVNVREGYDYVVYWGNISFSTTDSTDNVYTQAMFVGDCDVITGRGTLQVFGKGVSGSDVDMFIEGSSTLYSSAFVSTRVDTILNLLGATTPRITYVGSAFITESTLAAAYSPVADPAANCAWIRLKADGQTGNESATEIFWYIILKKHSGAERRGYPRVANTVTTNEAD